MDDLLTYDELAPKLKVSDRTLKRLVAHREIPYIKVGRLVRFDLVEVKRYLRRQTVKPEE